jgi:hypothetical protein
MSFVGELSDLLVGRGEAADVAVCFVCWRLCTSFRY